jgi:hypothetical protein
MLLRHRRVGVLTRSDSQSQAQAEDAPASEKPLDRASGMAEESTDVLPAGIIYSATTVATDRGGLADASAATSTTTVPTQAMPEATPREHEQSPDMR